MSLDRRLLDILCCPVSKVAVQPLTAAQLDALNRAIGERRVQRVDGAVVEAALAAGLVTIDGKVIYRVDDGVPVMLPEEGIGTTQLDGFPRQA